MRKNLDDHPEWRLWLSQNIQRGSDKVGLFKILIENNFDPMESCTLIYNSIGRDITAGKTKKSQSFLRQNNSDNYDWPGPKVEAGGPLVSKILTNKLQLYILPDFLSEEECQSIVNAGNSSLRPSEVSYPGNIGEGGTTAAHIDQIYRSSQTCDLGLLDNKDIKLVDEKISKAMGLPLILSEGTQLQRYEIGQEFRKHTDYFEPGTKEYVEFCSGRGNRTWTFMIYLNDVEKGGGTHFFSLKKTISPRAGTAIAWNNLYSDGQVNSNTMHAGLPVEAGHKSIVTKWFREN